MRKAINLMNVALTAFVVLTLPGCMEREVADSAPVERQEQSAEDRLRAERASQGLMTALKLKTLGEKEVTALLLNERFEEFERISLDLEEKFGEDVLYEMALNEIYRSADIKDLRILGKLDKWVEIRPGYMSYAARGVHKERLGYAARGNDFIQNTPQENIRKMRDLHEEARKDLQRAIKLNPEFVPAYESIIWLETASGRKSEAKRYHDLSLKYLPGAYQTKVNYLESLTPKWGGSFMEMQNYIDSLDKYYDLNPRLWSIRGKSYYEKAVIVARRKEHRQAIKYYTKALSYGDRTDYLRLRGVSYFYMGDCESASRDFEKILQYNSKHEKAIEWQQYLKREKMNTASDKCKKPKKSYWR